MYIRIGKR